MGGIGTNLVMNGGGHYSARSITIQQGSKANPRIEKFNKTVINEQGLGKLQFKLGLALDALNGNAVTENTGLFGEVKVWRHDFDKAGSELDQVLSVLKPLSQKDIKTLTKNQRSAIKEMRRRLFRNLKAIYDFQLPENMKQAEVKFDLGDGFSHRTSLPRSFQTSYNNPPEISEDMNPEDAPDTSKFERFEALLKKDRAIALKKIPLTDIQSKVQAIWDRMAEIASIKSQDFSSVRAVVTNEKRHDQSSKKLQTALHSTNNGHADISNITYSGNQFKDLKAYATETKNTNTNLRFLQKGLITRIKSFIETKDTNSAKDFLAELSKLNDVLDETSSKLSPFEIAKRKIQTSLAAKRSLDFLKEQKQAELNKNLSAGEQAKILSEIQEFDELDIDGIDHDKTSALASLVLKGELSDDAIGQNHDAALVRLLRSLKIRAQSSMRLLSDTLTSVKNLSRIILNKEPIITSHKSKYFLSKLDVTEKAILDESSENMSDRLRTGIPYLKSHDHKDWVRPNKTELDKFNVSIAA